MAKFKITRIYEVQAEDKQEALRVLNQTNWDLTHLSWQGIAEVSTERKGWATIAKEQWSAKPTVRSRVRASPLWCLQHQGGELFFWPHRFSAACVCKPSGCSCWLLSVATVRGASRVNCTRSSLTRP
jgi:hypothetical protein